MVGVATIIYEIGGKKDGNKISKTTRGRNSTRAN